MIKDLKAYYKGKKVFVTGHTGFKGSWLCLWLNHMGAEVTGYSLPPEQGSTALFDIISLNKKITSVIGDIRDLKSLTSSLQKSEAEIVFHLAAQPLVRLSYRDPIETFSTNVMGTVNVFEAVKATKSVKNVVSIATDKCYENQEWVWPYRETDALGGFDPYSASKGCAEIVASSYRRSFFATSDVYLATARGGNVLGGGDFSEDRILPDVVRSCQSGKPVEIRSPLSVRPWQFVLDALNGYLILGHKLSSGLPSYQGAFNFSPPADQAYTVQELTSIFTSKLGQGKVIIKPDPHAPHEANILRLDSTKAHSLLGWSSKLDLNSSLAWTAEWYSQYLKGEQGKAESLILEQIKVFEEL